jgi:hypothetical protein
MDERPDKIWGDVGKRGAIVPTFDVSGEVREKAPKAPGGLVAKSTELNRASNQLRRCGRRRRPSCARLD